MFEICTFLPNIMFNVEKIRVPWRAEHLEIFLSVMTFGTKFEGFTAFFRYCQHSYESTQHTYQISCQLAEKCQRYDTI